MVEVLDEPLLVLGVAQPGFGVDVGGDDAIRRRVWDVLDYDLSAFWPGGPTDPNYVAVRIVPERVELSKMFGSQDKRVWRR